jgi:hypothetical protein
VVLKESDEDNTLEIEIDPREHPSVASCNAVEVLSDITRLLVGSCSPITLSEMRYLRSMLCDTTYIGGKLDIPSGSIVNPIHLLSLDVLYGIWYMVDKLDGERRYMCITPLGMYSVDRYGRIYVIKSLHMMSNRVYLLDTELFDEVHHVHDILVHRNRDVTGDILHERLRCIDEFLLIDSAELSYDGLSGKPYAPLIGLHSIISRWDIIRGGRYDGIILVDAVKGYFSTQYKIKQSNTVDLMFLEGHMRTSDSASIDRWVANDVLEGDGLYELAHIAGSLHPIRRRTDKRHPNSKRAVDDILSSLCMADLQVDDRMFVSMRRYHNYVKRLLIGMSHPKHLLDVGSGRGGDVPKWEKISRVYCVEKDKKALRELSRRYPRCKNVVTICAKMSNYIKVKCDIDMMIDGVTVFFSLMMMDDKDIRGLLETIQRKGSTNMVIQLIYMDAALTAQKLDHPHVSGIVTRTSDSTVRVSIPGSNVVDNDEMLTDISALETLLRNEGFRTTISRRSLVGDVPMLVREHTVSSLYVVHEMVRGYDNDPVYWLRDLISTRVSPSITRWVVEISSNGVPTMITRRMCRYDALVGSREICVAPLSIDVLLCRSIMRSSVEIVVF